MRSPLACTLLLAALAVPPAALAQPSKSGGDDRGELWEITSSMEMPGMPMAMPANTQRICMGREAGDDKYVPKNDDCRLISSSRSGNTQRYKMVCGGKQPMTADGEITHAKDTYSGRTRMTGKSEDGEPIDMTHRFSARRLGECTGTIQNQVAKLQAQGDAQVADACRQGLQQLTTQLYFGEGAVCGSRRAEFCAEVRKLAASARDPAGYTALRARSANAGPAFSACNQDFAAVTRAACGRASETRNFQFIASGSCDDDVRKLGETSCKGRSFTSIDESMRGVCSRYAAITRGQPGGTETASAQPAAAPKAPDPVQQGLDAVRKLLPF